MKLEKIRSEDLIFTNSIEDDRTNTYIQLNDYDWMDYNLTTQFKTEKMGVLNVKFNYFGTTESTMEVEQILGEMHQKITYEYPTGIFQKYIIKLLDKHIRFWDSKYSFNGEEEVVDFFNDVIEKGVECNRENMSISDNCKGCCHDGCCRYFSKLNTYDISIPEEEQKAFEEFCCGCCCGDGAECNRDQGCDNYEIELIMG